MTLREIRREHVRTIFRQAIIAAHPSALMHKSLHCDGRWLYLAAQGSHEVLAVPAEGRVVTIAVGKASVGMALATAEILGSRLSEGIVVAPTPGTDIVSPLKVFQAGHPLPDDRGLTASREVTQLLSSLRPEDVLIVLLSGGASALLPAPPDGISLEEKRSVTAQLLKCGAPISQINTVRKHLSRLKGGGIARLAGGASIVTLMLSDVVGDDPAIIGSGPTFDDPSTFSDVRGILDHYGLWNTVADSIRDHIMHGINGAKSDVPRSSVPRGRRIAGIIGSNATARTGAANAARGLGYRLMEVSQEFEGEASMVGAGFARKALEQSAQRNGAYCMVAGGETTVTVRGNGVGGRNQELCVSAALELDGVPDVVLLGASTDGIDGPTDAAGALVDGGTAGRARMAGWSASQTLTNNDSYAYLAASGDLIRIGPTGTNVMDLLIAIGG
jgi:glycerate-2-kinase